MKHIATVSALSCIGFTTLAASFMQPTIIHQLVVWSAGAFAALFVMAFFLVKNWPAIDATSEPERHDGTQEQGTVLAVNALREYRFSDVAIARMLNLDIDVVSVIPSTEKDL